MHSYPTINRAILTRKWPFLVYFSYLITEEILNSRLFWGIWSRNFQLPQLKISVLPRCFQTQITIEFPTYSFEKLTLMRIRTTSPKVRFVIKMNWVVITVSVTADGNQRLLQIARGNSRARARRSRTVYQSRGERIERGKNVFEFVQYGLKG